jgi:hypothetical protein
MGATPLCGEKNSWFCGQTAIAVKQMWSIGSRDLKTWCPDAPHARLAAFMAAGPE